ncbi:MAG: aminopeptidase N [Rhodobacterales bacterium]|nr:MAG: aminopeptidase N [Rhodobacterales bacterium]
MTDQTIYLADYTPFPFAVEAVDLTFVLDPAATRVRARIRFVPKPDSDGSLHLHGHDLTLISAAIDGTAVTPELTDDGLRVAVPDAPFTWESEVEINPQANTALEGLYMSKGLYCTQCEAEGFRRITYYPDRPDVMAPFTVRIEGDAPVLLSNGEMTASGNGWAEWHDPWPKPAYLFALVAGDLHAREDHFTTSEGRDVTLNIWVRDGDQDKTAWAMESLKASMAWDERTYGRAYDLDLFNIVAIDDFNGGAMENKGLNIFNAALVLASPETTTDDAYERIESVIAHEYFHNWTGNRITCRDWFQLCLKEGLTVFRDQQFTSDMRSAPVKRIDDTLMLRAVQFREDAGPLAHPVRPESFVEINNFYTATVYEKGAEVIGMLKRLVGDADYARAVDLYFKRHDGQACTIEDWLACFEDTTGRDLTQFKLWYSQAGTPRVTLRAAQENGELTLHLSQDVPPTPGQADKAPMVIPLAVGLLDGDGQEIAPTRLIELTKPQQSEVFDIPEGADVAVSVNRGFSAPVLIDQSALPDRRALLFAHDTDPFARWEAGRSLSKTGLMAMIAQGAPVDDAYLTGLGNLLDDDLDPAFKALCLALPGEDDLAQSLFDAGTTPDPDAIHAAHKALRAAMAGALEPQLARLFDTHQVPGPYSPQAEDAGRRALANAALSLLSLRDGGERARAQFAQADNMTQSLAALAALLRIGEGQDELTAFETRWSGNALVMDRWLSLQVAHAAPDQAAATAERLTQHTAFDAKNPNRLRAVFGALAGNAAGFHHRSGAGYRLFADRLIATDPLNPQFTARLSSAFQSWARYDADRQQMMRAQLERIAALPGLSRDTGEMVTRILGAEIQR